MSAWSRRKKYIVVEYRKVTRNICNRRTFTVETVISEIAKIESLKVRRVLKQENKVKGTYTVYI